MINLKVKTLDSQTYDFTVDSETTVRQFKETIAEKTKISADLQRIIYCGRVLVDEKPLKEYNVNGKVVHVVERPPPTTPNVAASGNSNNAPSENARRRNGTQIRGTPIFRGLWYGGDGMTMAIPMNGQSQGNIPSLNPSSFCMNRITVARHMLDCVNNIISYLEHPERGLNNSTLDILTQGRFTMESTVVEVGISAASDMDLTQNQTQNIMDVFRRALSAAIPQDRHQNVTVLQLPNLLNSDGLQPNNNIRSNVRTMLANSVEVPQHDPVISSSDEHDNENSASTEENTLPRNADPPRENTENARTPNVQLLNDAARNRRSNSSRRSNSQQRTRTRALAAIVEHMRSVQVRLEPYVQQYYDILDNEPEFEENDTAGRENTQRIFDRVSEAMHYMSHALHAISDLMLDLTQCTPRYLSCRPILVEQSGFVSSNNYIPQFMPPNDSGIPANTATNNNQVTQQQTPQQQQPPQQQPQQSASQNASTTIASPSLNTSNGSGSGGGRSTTTVTPENSTNASGSTTPVGSGSSGDEQPNAEIVLNMPRRVLIPTNPQLQVARLIQAVVNSAPIDADLHVQINAPNFMSVGIPIGAVAGGVSGPLFASTTQGGNQQPNNNATSSTQPSTPNSSTSNSTSSNTTSTSTESENQQEQPRVTTATHPTTSTQTRSTPRPQAHVANLAPNWSYRDMPENILSSFDRFLPCSSHHIRDAEQNQSVPEPASDGNSPNLPNIVIPNILYRTRASTRETRRRRANMFSPVVRNQAGSSASGNEDVGFHAHSNEGNETNNNSANRPTQNATPSNIRNQNTTDEIRNLSNDELNISMNIFGSNLTLRDLIQISPSTNLLNRIRSELLTGIIENLFAGSTITEENMTNAINNLLEILSDVLLFLPQFDLPDYDSRASVENYLRTCIPFMITLINEDSSDDFGTRFLLELTQFTQRLLMILITCIGRNNAELYLNQISQMAISSDIAEEQEPLRTLHRQLRLAITRQLDLTTINSSDIQQYLVIRRPPPESGQTLASTPMETDDVPQQPVTNITSTSATNSDMSGLTLPNPNERPMDEPLPAVSIGSEPWHSHFPPGWLPIITRDTERQRKQPNQPPFSDAYISGMSAKRRKLVTNSKSPTDIPHLIADGVKKTIQIAGLSQSSTSTSNNVINNNNINGNLSSSSNSSNTNINDISVSIASDPITQSSYIESLRTSIQDRLDNDKNYDPKKFPNSAKYFSK